MNDIFRIVTDGDAIYLFAGEDDTEPLDGFEVKSEMSEADINAMIRRMVVAFLDNADVRGLFF
jgi:hypothetical protein